MKKGIFTILCLTLLVANVAAQSKKVNIGITAGPSIDWLSSQNDQYDKGGVIVGLRYGIPLDINLTKDENYYFSTGVKVEHTGGKVKYTGRNDAFQGKDVFITTKYSAIFLSVPTGIKLKTPSFNNFVIAGNVGLSHAFALNSKKFDRIKDGNKEFKEKTKYEGHSFFKESLYAGLGLEYIIKENLRASFMVNYSYTFTNYHNKNILNEFNPKERLKGNLGVVDFMFGIFF